MRDDNDREIASLRNELNKLDKEKEGFFAQSKENNNKIKALSNEVNRLKKERNDLTDSVKKVKAERDKFNTELKRGIEEFKKKAPKKEKGINIGFLKKEIKAMDYKIETEGLSFDKEQKLMKIIKEKKKIVVENTGSMELSHEIDKVRAKADAAHKQTREKADASQQKHEQVIEKSNLLKELIKKQREINKKCNEYKKKVGEINQRLVSKLQDIVSRNKQKPKQHGKPRVDIAGMQQKAEEKLKKGGTLTTDDLLAFQNKK